jgi:8-oxo-dGTP diphosphatase
MTIKLKLKGELQMFYVNVEGAVFKDDKWLIIGRSMKEEHAGGLLSLVGGTVENEGNTKDILERTIKRELFEEVGIS